MSGTVTGRDTTAGAARPLPPGAVRWSRQPYIGPDGRHVFPRGPVPVDECGQPVTTDPAAGQPEPDRGRVGLPAVPWPALWHSIHAPVRAWYAVAVLAAAGFLLDAGVLPGWVVPVAAPAGVAAAYAATRWLLVGRARRRGRLDPSDPVAGARRRALYARRARYGAYCTTAGYTWLGLVALVGADPATMAGLVVWVLLAVGSAVAAVPYWRYVRTRRPTPDPADRAARPVAATGPAAAALEAAQRWKEHVAVVEGVRHTAIDPGSWRTVVGGWSAVVHATRPGMLDDEVLTGRRLRRLIAGTWDVPKSAINVVCDWEDNPNQALLLVQPDSPLRASQRWPGAGSIDITAGTAVIGTYVDGRPVIETLYRPGWGAPSRLIIGTKGSGKSEFLRLLLLIQRYTTHTDPATGAPAGTVASFLHDPKRGQSFAPLRRIVHAFGTTGEDAHIMVDALIREMDRRYDLLAGLEWVDAKGRTRIGDIPWDITAHGPLLSWTIDEFHELVRDPTFVAKLELLARKMRACAIEVNIATHLGTLADTGTTALRDMLAGGTATVFRTTSALSATLATGGQLAADPRFLPDLPGMCYTMAGEQPSVLARMAYLPPDELYDLLYDEDNQPIGHPAALPPQTLDAFGPEWVAWAEADRQRSGRPATGTWTHTSATAAPATMPDVDDDAGQTQSATNGLLAILTETGGPTKRDAILQHPHWTWSNRTLTNALKAVQHQQLAVRAAGGVYQLTPTGRARHASHHHDDQQAA